MNFKVFLLMFTLPIFLSKYPPIFSDISVKSKYRYIRNYRYFVPCAKIGLFIQITEEMDGVFLYKRHHKYPIPSGVEIVHVSDQSIPLVKRALAVDDRLGGIGTRDKRSRRRLLPLHQDDERVEYQPVKTF